MLFVFQNLLLLIILIGRHRSLQHPGLIFFLFKALRLIATKPIVLSRQKTSTSEKTIKTMQFQQK